MTSRSNLKVPIYSHHVYDIVPDQHQIVHQPDVVILEGLNLLQPCTIQTGDSMFISDFIDMTIYLDADISYIKRWYIDRFLNFREQARCDQTAFFHRFTKLSDEQARCFAEHIWKTVNEKNLQQNILPYREHADVILCKGADHYVERIKLGIPTLPACNGYTDMAVSSTSASGGAVE